MIMKHVMLTMMAGLLMAVATQSCKKDTNDPEENGSKGKLSDAVPEEYLKELKDNGMRLHEGSNPPNIEGKYLFSPLLFEFNSLPLFSGQLGRITDDEIRIQFSGQGAGSQDIEVTAESRSHLMNATSSHVLASPFVVGSGNDFTVCFELSQYTPDAFFTITYAYLVSGTKEGNVLKDVQLARVCINDDKLSEAYREAYQDIGGRVPRIYGAVFRCRRGF